MRPRFQALVTITTVALLALPFGAPQAEKATLKIMAPWEAEGEIFKIGPERLQFVGKFDGIMYIEDEKSEEGDFHTAIMVCPAVQEIDVKTSTTHARGHCHIIAPRGNVFAKFDCKGKIGSCEGTFELTGGTEELEGISGSGKMQMRAALGNLSLSATTGTVIREAAGLVIWPALNVNIPDAK
ncbi:MAG: hypothetical protein PVI15_05600 [Chromatiales bacterium]|jgi:hypothetical protein